MSQVMMIRSLLNSYVIDIKNNSTDAGAGLDAFPAKSGTVPVLNPGAPQPKIAADQSWEVLPDPAGSKHFIIKNPATGLCIDIQGNSLNAGAALDAFTVKNKDNQNQLWDLLPDPFGSDGFFIQNPQTGFVIEIEHGSDTKGAALVINPRRLFDSNRQLWSGMLAGGSAADDLPLLTIAPPPFATLIGSAQYVLAPTDPTRNLTGIKVTLDVIEDLVAASFSVQINGTPPFLPKSPFKFDVDFIQFGMVMQNNSLVLFTQIYPPGKPHQHPAFPQPSVDEESSTMLGLENNTIPAGTRIVLSLATDPKNNDFVTSVTGRIFNSSGTQIGTPVTWSIVGQPTWIGNSPTGPPVTEADLAPLGAFQVVVVGPPSGTAHFSKGLGTITVAATPDISAQSTWPGAADGITGGTGEQSNIFYGLVQDGQHPQIAQPFGVPSPKLAPSDAFCEFNGTGLYPNSKLKATSQFTLATVNPVPAVPGLIESLSATSGPDGSFQLSVVPANSSVLDEVGTTLGATVTDSFGDWAECGCAITGWPKNEVTRSSGTSTVVH